MNFNWFTNFIAKIFSKTSINSKQSGVIEITNTTSSNSTYAAGRVTVDKPYSNRFNRNDRIKAKDKLNTPWQMTFLDESVLGVKSTTDILNLLKDVSRDLDRALHDFVQFVVTSYELTCDNTEGQRIVDEALLVMRNKKEPFMTKLEKASASIFLHGAIFSELVLDLQGINFSNLKIIDATIVEFEPTVDEVDGEGYRLGQVKNGQFVDLQDDPTISYIPFNSVSDSPVGRSLSSSAIFPLIFSLMILKDLRQVIRTQAYPFKVATFDREKLQSFTGGNKEEMDSLVETEKQKLIGFLDQQAGPYNSTPIFGDEIDIKMIEGIKGTNLSSIETLIQIIEKMIVRGLKTYGIIFGINTGTGLSDNSPVQAELHYNLIDSIQRKIEGWIEENFTLILRSRGNTGTVSFKLKRINALVSRIRTQIKSEQTSVFKVWDDQGWISTQEARYLILDPEPFEHLNTILPRELPPDAQRTPNEIIEVDEESQRVEEE